MISKYNDFLLEKEFNSIIDEIFLLIENEGTWLSDKEIEWDLSKKPNKLKSFLSKLPKEKIKEYFKKFLDRIKSLPKPIKKRIILANIAIFLAFLPYDYVINSFDKQDKDIIETIESKKIEPKISSFFIAHNIVKGVEKGYSSDKADKGNFVKVPGGKRFIGTNHGISAQTLMNYMGKLPTKEDMINLSYETAIKIFKKNYWDVNNLYHIHNQSLANIIYDGVVNQGVTYMKNALRSIYRENGINIEDNENPFEYSFIEELNKKDPSKIFENIKEKRESRYKSSKTFKKHGEGWIKRLNSIEFKP